MDIDKWFSKLLDDPLNELVQKAMDEGQIPIGYSCSYVPDVILSVDGLFPVRMRAPGIAGTELADNYLSSVICSYTRSLLEFALDGRYDFLQGWVFAASCDHLRRLYDNLEYLRRPGFSRILDVPHKTGDAAITWYTEELQAFSPSIWRTTLALILGQMSLAKAIREHNRFNAILREIGEHRRGRPSRHHRNGISPSGHCGQRLAQKGTYPHPEKNPRRPADTHPAPALPRAPPSCGRAS